MKLTPENLQKQWDSIKYKDGSFLQIDTMHPLEWYIGYQSVSQKTLLLVSDTEIDVIESSKSMAVSRRRREVDKRWTLSFELLRDEQQDVFAILCCDVIEYSRGAISEKEALTLAISRYRQWGKLLAQQRGGLMNENLQKGLLGELLFLEERINSQDFALEAIQGWVGADGADQDFVYSDGWFEVKCIGASAIGVTISSLEQLDCSDAGELVIKRVDKTAPERSGAISLNDIVHCIIRQIDGEALELFCAKLYSYGYIDLQKYSEQKYYYSVTQRYRVDDSFPRITRKMVAKQISSLRYELNLPSLAEWLKE